MPILQFEKIVQSLRDENVNYVLVGGMAAIGHGMNYITNDVDICYDRNNSNIKSLVHALSNSSPKLRTREGAIPFLFDELTIKKGLNFTLDTNWGPIDLLGELKDIGGYQELIVHAEEMEFYHVSVKVISLDDLIRAKEKAGRPKDQHHLMELKAIKKIKESKNTG